MQTNFHRPEPILSHQARPAHRMSPRRAAERLCEGQTLIVSDSYHTGAEILAQLEQLLPEPEEGHTTSVDESTGVTIAPPRCACSPPH